MAALNDTENKANLPTATASKPSAALTMTVIATTIVVKTIKALVIV